ncbi:alpha/beta fold hydrolase [Bdellovibrio sp. NC01]|uniref:alpha/beta fold hydrolase n=1 Tax=Bdellovibrio sp. NC01 TaxID=2220073 RepID=UPI00115B5737|nr:alpha/beta hydrolase [Bdellovibrio sp. NC01]QDK38161.1 alpha/beta hydrolase [Bdellovibrio sp. NC01]
MNSSHPIVLIPGLACSARLFEAQIPSLWQFGSVQIADHRQHDTMSEIAKEILATAPPKFTLMGLSMGGYISFEILRQAPERVMKLALLDTSARPDTAEQTAARKVAMDQATSGKYEEAMKASLPFVFHDFDNPRLQKIFLQMTEDTGIDAFLRQQNAIMSRPDSRPDLKNILCPTLVLGGREDKLTPPEVMSEIANGLPRSEYVTIPNCGHASTLEQPELVTNALVKWLKK